MNKYCMPLRLTVLLKKLFYENHRVLNSTKNSICSLRYHLYANWDIRNSVFLVLHFLLKYLHTAEVLKGESILVCVILQNNGMGNFAKKMFRPAVSQLGYSLQQKSSPVHKYWKRNITGYRIFTIQLIVFVHNRASNLATELRSRD